MKQKKVHIENKTSIFPASTECPDNEFHTSSTEFKTVMSLSQNGNLLELVIDIETLSRIGIIDTGASTSYIASYLLDDPALLHLKSQIKLLNATAAIANQDTVKISGSLTVTIKINQQEFIVNFLILDALLYDIILGLDFCKQYKVIINCEENQVTINDSPIHSSAVRNALCTTEKVELPAYTER